MATSKALQAKEWWEEIDASGGAKCMVQPYWLDRARCQAKSKRRKVDDDQPTPNPSRPYGRVDTAVHPTLHAERRMAQRNLSEKEIEYVLLYGQIWHQAGAIIVYLRRKDIPLTAEADQRWQQLVGATVVMKTEGERIMLTAYRNRDSGLRKIKHKQDYGWN